MTPRAPGARRLAMPFAVLSTLLVARAWAGDDSLGSVEITIVADETCAPRLREVIAEQLGGVAANVDWACRGRFDLEEPFRAAPRGRAAVRIWIDVSGSAEARLTLGDDRSERFMVRRIPLPSGLDEIGREEIGQIVRSAALALREGRSETLTRAEAEVALSDWPAPAPPRKASPRVEDPVTPPTAARVTAREPTGARAPAARPVVELGPAWSLQAFSSQIPVVQEIALALVVGGASWPLAVWSDLGYRLPATYRSDPVGVELQALSLRTGLLLVRRPVPALSLGAGAGVGVEWISFAPRAGAAAIDAAPPDRFFAVAGRLLLAADLRASPHLTLGLRLSCDVATTNIHFDFRDAGGVTRRVLAPFGLRPGLTLAAAWRF